MANLNKDYGDGEIGRWGAREAAVVDGGTKLESLVGASAETICVSTLSEDSSGFSLVTGKFGDEE